MSKDQFEGVGVAASRRSPSEEIETADRRRRRDGEATGDDPSACGEDIA